MSNHDGAVTPAGGAGNHKGVTPPAAGAHQTSREQTGGATKQVTTTVANTSQSGKQTTIGTAST